ncbi:hypothetical protein [Paenibacillus roseipurpureus]|uniref:Uncharacterized protein n=1 Tax=Paenibacillus roseopurpureus TaxID=2918901 RepID=A0AA96RJJ1_9BACL|nr:hypothetical protein [Paenibacillus sp. MBLB1832]WNR43221.1 hypothetical protein MJB10_19195 [Paenibacillus sp. MBLB1832]
MKLNWRKIILIIVCAECLFIYWHTLGTMTLKKQQTTPIVSPSQSKVPLTQLQPATPSRSSS